MAWEAGEADALKLLQENVSGVKINTPKIRQIRYAIFLVLFNSWRGGPNLGRWAQRPKSPASELKKMQYVALEPGPAPQLGCFPFFNSPLGCLFFLFCQESGAGVRSGATCDVF